MSAYDTSVPEFLVPTTAPLPAVIEHKMRYVFASKSIRGEYVLDVACGSGYGSVFLCRSVQEYVGVDISMRALKYAKAFYKNEHVNLVRADACHLPFETEAFDAITTFETIEHIKRADLFVSECARVLRENGDLLCSTPNAASHPDNWKSPYHLKEYSLNELATLLSTNFNHISFFGQYWVNRTLVNIVKLLSKLNRSVSLRIKYAAKMLAFARQSENDLTNKFRVEPLYAPSLVPSCLFVIASKRKSGSLRT